MRSISKSEMEELLKRGARVLNKEEKRVDDSAYKEILKEYIKNMVSLEDSISVIEDSLLNEIGEMRKKIVGKKAQFEFTIERDSRGLLKKVIARER